jgi:hypothetical protein
MARGMRMNVRARAFFFAYFGRLRATPKYDSTTKDSQHPFQAPAQGHATMHSSPLHDSLEIYHHRF